MLSVLLSAAVAVFWYVMMSIAKRQCEAAEAEVVQHRGHTYIARSSGVLVGDGYHPRTFFRKSK